MVESLPYFAREELACKGCAGTCYWSRGDKPICNVDPEAGALLVSLREAVGVPVIINSACRCPRHNAAVGGAPLSDHRTTDKVGCRGFDIRITPALDKRTIVETALSVGFNAIGGGYRSFVHIGKRPGSRIRTW